MKRFIGVDVGGTRIKAGLVNEQHEVESEEIIWLEAKDKTADGLLTRLVEVIPRVLGSVRPVAIGLGVPGVVETRSIGMLCRSPNFPQIRDFRIKSALEERLGYPVMLDNDANCVIAGEYLQGAVAGVKDFIGLTLGTGVGGGIVLRGALWRGSNGMAGELGHLVIDPAGPECPATGVRGPLEMYPSVVGLRHMCESQPVDNVDSASPKLPELLAQAAEDGDATARKHFATAGDALGRGLGNLLNIFAVKTVLLAGGVSRAYPWMKEATETGIRSIAFPEIADDVSIRCAILGEKAGVLGAAMQWMMQPHDEDSA